MKDEFKKRLIGAVVWMSLMWVVYQFIGNGLRLGFIALGFIAMWGLWDAREKRGENWPPKMQDIWFCHMLFVFATIEGNVELFYRDVTPTWAAYLVSYLYVLTIRCSRKDSSCSKIYEGKYIRRPHVH